MSSDLSDCLFLAYPTEIAETYYIASSLSKAPTGKLYSQFNNYKSKMSLVGLCLRRSRNSNANSSTATTSNIEFESIDIKEEKMEAGSIDYNLLDVVKSSDWSDINFFKNCWKSTYDQRQEIFSQMNTLDYLALFPYTIQSDVGYELVCILFLFFKYNDFTL